MKIPSLRFLLIAFAVLFAFACGSNPTGPGVPTTGSIRVTSVPTGAQVFLDGVDKGQTTNCTLTNIAPGNRTVRLVLAGYTEYQGTATVTAGATANVTATLTPDAQAGALSVTPANGLVSSGASGGPFTPASQAYTLENTGGSAINWTVAATQAWITVAPASGTLGAGLSTQITASINNAANTLAAGDYTDTLTFTNTTNSVGNTTRSVSLQITPASQTLSVTVDYTRVLPMPNPNGLDFPILAWSTGPGHLGTRGLTKVNDDVFTSPFVPFLTETVIRIWILDDKMHNGTTQIVCRTIKVNGQVLDVGTTIYGETSFIIGTNGVVRKPV